MNTNYCKHAANMCSTNGWNSVSHYYKSSVCTRIQMEQFAPSTVCSSGVSPNPSPEPILGEEEGNPIVQMKVLRRVLQIIRERSLFQEEKEKASPAREGALWNCPLIVLLLLFPLACGRMFEESWWDGNSS